MILRRHEADGVESEALYSDCERYRYVLSRTWGDGPRIAYVMLNPSKATELANDPTIERCQRRAARLGFSAMRIVNLFAWRETSPAALKQAAAPVGEANDDALRETLTWADMTLSAWGVHGTHRNRHADVLTMLGDAPLYHLGLTKDGLPRHPLYVSYDVVPAPWIRNA